MNANRTVTFTVFFVKATAAAASIESISLPTKIKYFSFIGEILYKIQLFDCDTEGYAFRTAFKKVSNFLYGIYFFNATPYGEPSLLVYHTNGG